MKDSTTEAGTPTGALPATGYVRQSDLIGSRDQSVRGIIPFSQATLWRKVKAKEFTAPVKLSAGVTAWRVEDIRAWMAEH
jgi:prophage regulatory protein